MKHGARGLARGIGRREAREARYAVGNLLMRLSDCDPLELTELFEYHCRQCELADVGWVPHWMRAKQIASYLPDAPLPVRSWYQDEIPCGS